MIASVPTLYVLYPDLYLSPWYVKDRPLPPWEAARALRLPLSVLTHAFTSGQVPELVWFLAEDHHGRAVVRYDVKALRVWAATRPRIDTTVPTLPVYTAGHVAAVPAPRSEA